MRCISCCGEGVIITDYGSHYDVAHDTCKDCNGTGSVEGWREVPETEGIYFVSDLGNIKRIKTQTGKTIEKFPKCGLDSTGYRAIWLHLNGKLRYKKLHQLVARTFIGECPEGLVVNHKDCNKQNNKPSNLEYVTRAENVAHAVRNHRFPSKKGQTNPNARLTDKQTEVIRRVWKEKKVSQNELSIITGISRHQIGLIVTNKSRGK